MSKDFVIKIRQKKIIKKIAKKPLKKTKKSLDGEKGRKGRKIGKKDEKDKKGVISVTRSFARPQADGNLKNSLGN